LSFVIFGDLRMKKSLIALAALATVAGAAQAQSSVSVYGIVDAGFNSKDSDTIVVKSNAASVQTTKTKAVSSGNESTSRLGFRGTEDLGGGLKANFVVETGLVPTEATVSTWNTRQAYVGLEGKLGTLNAGTVYTPHHTITSAFSPSTLPGVVGDLQYATGFSAAAISTNGIIAANTYSVATLDNTATLTTGAVGADTVAKLNNALVAAGLANGTAGSSATTAPTGQTTGVKVALTALTGSGGNATAAEINGMNQAITAVNSLTAAKATADLNARLARATNASYTVRVNNTVAYQSPVLNGLTAGIAYVLPTQTKVEGGDETTSSATALNLQYATGPFAAAVAYTAGESKSITNVAAVTASTASISANALTTLTTQVTDIKPVAALSDATRAAASASSTTVEVKTKEQLAALSYDLGVAKVSYIYNKRDAKDTISDLSEKTVHKFGVKAPFGKTTAFAIYSTGDQKVLDGTANAAKFDLDGIQVGASYALSKRTDVYAIYGTQKMDNVASSNDLKDKQYAVGVRHSF
jgi:predicted porin